MKKIISILSFGFLGFMASAGVHAQDFSKVQDFCYQNIEKLNSEDLKNCVQQFQALVVEQQNYIQQAAQSDPQMLAGSDPQMINEINLSDPQMINGVNLSDPQMINK